MPFASEWVAGRRLPETAALHEIVAFATGPLVSLSVAARLAENRLPARAGLGAVVNAVCFSVSFVSTSYVYMPWPASGAMSAWEFVRSGLPDRKSVV